MSICVALIICHYLFLGLLPQNRVPSDGRDCALEPRHSSWAHQLCAQQGLVPTLLPDVCRVPPVPAQALSLRTRLGCPGYSSRSLSCSPVQGEVGFNTVVLACRAGIPGCFAESAGENKPSRNFFLWKDHVGSTSIQEVGEEEDGQDRQPVLISLPEVRLTLSSPPVFSDLLRRQSLGVGRRPDLFICDALGRC